MQDIEYKLPISMRLENQKAAKTLKEIEELNADIMNGRKERYQLVK